MSIITLELVVTTIYTNLATTFSHPPKEIFMLTTYFLNLKGTNAGRIMSRWDPALIEEKLRPVCMRHSGFKIQNKDGQQIFFQAAMPPNRERPMYNGHRADIHKVFYEYAKSLGVEFNMGQKVTGYQEDAASGKAWIETESGEIFKGDVVVGADGVRSRARKLILGYEDKPRSSGYSVWRAWFNAEENGVTTDPLTKEFVENGDTHTGWLGDDMHLLVASCKGGKEISWVCTRKVSSAFQVFFLRGTVLTNLTG